MISFFSIEGPSTEDDGDKAFRSFLTSKVIPSLGFGFDRLSRFQESLLFSSTEHTVPQRYLLMLNNFGTSDGDVANALEQIRAAGGRVTPLPGGWYREEPSLNPESPGRALREESQPASPG